MGNPIPVRLPDEMRDQLEKSLKRRRPGWNLSEEIRLRIRLSLQRERDKNRDPAAQGLCHVLGEIIAGISVGLDSKENWRTNPFLFRTVQLAFTQLLDALKPEGEISPPIKSIMADDLIVSRPYFVPGAGFVWDADTTPEQLAPFICAVILGSLQAASVSKKEEPEGDDLWNEAKPSAAQEQFDFGIADASQALIQSKGK